MRIQATVSREANFIWFRMDMDHHPWKSVLVSLSDLWKWPCKGRGKWTSTSRWPNTVCMCILSPDHYSLPIVPGLWNWGCVEAEVTYIRDFSGSGAFRLTDSLVRAGRLMVNSLGCYAKVVGSVSSRVDRRPGGIWNYSPVHQRRF